MWASAGITGFVVIGMFTAHGQAQVFAEGAVAVGVGGALAAGLLKWLVRLPWRDIVTIAVLASLWDNLTGRWR
jgi:hypothetical protein